MKNLVERIRDWRKSYDDEQFLVTIYPSEILKLCDAIDLLMDALPDIPPGSGEHSHLGTDLDHKDCDFIRETKITVEGLLK